MDDSRADDIDRLLAGDLSPGDQRRLAQAALDDGEVFDRVMAAAIAKSALESGVAAVDRPKDAGGETSRRRLWPVLVAAGAIAAALALAISYARPASRVAQPSPVARAAPSPAAIPMPILLTARSEAQTTPVFRTDEEVSRLPRDAGTVVDVHDGVVDLELGSLDGMTQGLDVGGLRIATVFRERSRARVVGASTPNAGDRIVVAPAVHVRALIDQAAARRAANDEATAEKLLALATNAAAAPSVPADLRRQSFEQLGILAHRAGRLTDASRALATAADTLDAAPAASPSERADTLNELGAVQIEQRDYGAAERTLASAQEHAAGATKMRVTNNLAAVKALEGDLAAAESLYRLALSVAGGAPQMASERASIERNLTAVTTAR